MNFSRVVFCDFDGTITTKDTLVSVLEKFAPEAATQFLPAIFRQETTLKSLIDKTSGSIPTQDYSALIKFVADQLIRPGLQKFIEFLNNASISLVVISEGLARMVKAALERQQLLASVTAIYAGEVGTTRNFLKPYSPISSDTEFIAKAIVMDQDPAEEKVAIGDSVTDINMSLAADLARKRLQQYLAEENKRYIPWQDFLRFATI